MTYRRILLIALLGIVQYASASMTAEQVTDMRLQQGREIANGTAIGSLFVAGAANTYAKSLPAALVPAAISCFKRDYLAAANHYFSQAIARSLTLDALAQGSKLAAKPAIKEHHQFVVSNTRALSKVARNNNTRIDAYVFIAAAERAADPTRRADLTDFGHWVEQHGPIYAAQIRANIKPLIERMAQSFDYCTPPQVD